MSRQKLTLQINSLEAMERLIGDDPIIEADFRQSCLEVFAKKHIKSLATVETIRNITEAIQLEIQSDLLCEIDTGRWSKTFVLKKETKDLIAKEVDYLIGENIKSEIYNTQKELLDKYLPRLEELLNEAAKRIDINLSDAVLTDRLNKMVDAKIKQRLGV